MEGILKKERERTKKRRNRERERERERDKKRQKERETGHLGSLVVSHIGTLHHALGREFRP